eukprot:3923-Heterococcus_DN1.PRE.1
MKKKWATDSGQTSSGRKSVKRASSRQTVLSKSMRVVDQATRNDVRSAQLDKLEADNYNEDQGAEGDDEFVDDDDEEDERPARKRQRAKGSSGKGGKGGGLSWRKDIFKSFNGILFEM